MSGYDRHLQFIETGKDEYGDDPEELREWLGDWQPEAFDLAAAKVVFDC